MLPEFVGKLDEKMEILYNQVEVSIAIKNTGQVKAEFLLLEVEVVGGWMNSKLILVSPPGPPAPIPRAIGGLDRTYVPSYISELHSRPGRHDVVVEDEPLRSNCLRIACEDFRHGLEYKYKFVVWLNPRSQEPLRIEAVVTAANLQGDVSSSLVLKKKINLVCVEDLLDLDELRFRKLSFPQERFQRAGDDFSGFEFD